MVGVLPFINLGDSKAVAGRGKKVNELNSEYMSFQI